MSAIDTEVKYLSTEGFLRSPAGAQALKVFKETASIAKAQRHLQDQGFDFEGRQGRAAYHWLANRLRRVHIENARKKRNRSAFLESPLGLAAAAKYREARSLRKTRDFLAAQGFDFEGATSKTERYMWTCNKMRPVTYELHSS